MDGGYFYSFLYKREEKKKRIQNIGRSIINLIIKLRIRPLD
jgi:hypothetical protein